MPDADDVMLEADQTAFREMKEALNPDVNVVMAKYNTGFDEDGNVTFSYFRERLIKNRAGMRWEGGVQEPGRAGVGGEQHRRLLPLRLLL